MLLTEEFARRLSALPISHFPDGSVLVAVADPTSVRFSDELRRALGAPVRFAVAAPEKIEAAITFVHQRPHAFVERGSRGTSSRDAIVMNVGLEDRDSAPASERERTRTSDLERRVPPEWPPLAAAMRWLERYLAEAEPRLPHSRRSSRASPRATPEADRLN